MATTTIITSADFGKNVWSNAHTIRISDRSSSFNTAIYWSEKSDRIIFFGINSFVDKLYKSDHFDKINNFAIQYMNPIEIKKLDNIQDKSNAGKFYNKSEYVIFNEDVKFLKTFIDYKKNISLYEKSIKKSTVRESLNVIDSDEKAKAYFNIKKENELIVILLDV